MSASSSLASLTSSIASATSSAASASSSAANNNNNNNNTTQGGPSSPLLFFVALGFGVVFTNLWIIVGVKYCFRYNQRNRARLAGHDEDAVDLGQMPQRRRRREKKLMSIEEVNEKFPLTKYKTWTTARAEKGLPTAGGINATTPSRPASIKNVSRVSMEASDEKHVTAESSSPVQPKVTTIHEEHSRPEIIRNDTDLPAAPAPAQIRVPHSSLPAANPTGPEGEEDADQIETAIPAEQLPDPGDTCAICIDNLEDDDDIRGLTCGHAFHATCVDPWLTGRRACCPLCKADYYIPKARTPGDEPQDLNPNASQTGERRPIENHAFGIFIGPAGRRLRQPPMNRSSGFGNGPFGRRIREMRQSAAQQDALNQLARQQSQATVGASPAQNDAQGRGWTSRLPNVSMPRFGRNRGTNTSAVAEEGRAP